MKNCELDIVTADVKQAVENLQNHGITVLRKDHGDDFTNLQKATREMLSKPAMLGSRGYYQKDCHKKMYDGFLMGDEAIKILMDEDIIKTVETYMGRPVLLQEMLIKHDLGDGELYFPTHTHTGEYREKQIPGPFSIGMMLYVHDTEEGAFCYAPGTQHWNSPHGSEVADYPPEMQKEINDKLCRIVGKAGDIVLFDHRGFHGPEQPVRIPRTVFLGGFHGAEDHGNMVKCPTAVYAHTLRGLSKTQLRVLGLESEGTIISQDKFHYFSFDKENKVAYGVLKLLAQGYFAARLGEFKLKACIKKMMAKNKD